MVSKYGYEHVGRGEIWGAMLSKRLCVVSKDCHKGGLFVLYEIIAIIESALCCNVGLLAVLIAMILMRVSEVGIRTESRKDKRCI
jgi:hypothetical protein